MSDENKLRRRLTIAVESNAYHVVISLQRVEFRHVADIVFELPGDL